MSTRRHPKGRTYDPDLYRYRKMRAALLRDRPVCSRCGAEMLFRGDEGYSPHHPLAATAHHVVPVAAGGSLTGELVAMHWRCNRELSDNVAATTRRAHTRDWGPAPAGLRPGG